VVASINFDDQPSSRGQEIHDETKHGHLATKLNTELLGPKRSPERGLRIRRGLTHPMSVSGED